MENSTPQSLSRVLVVGAGSIGERHVRCFQNTGRATVSICEQDPKRRAEVATQYNLASAYADLDATVFEKHDAVVVATPAHIHIAVAQRAVEAGCNVLIEKPLSVSTDGLAELLAAAASKNRLVAVAYVYRAHPSLAEMRNTILN